MNDTKSAIAPIDTEHLANKLRDAINSFKRVAAPRPIASPGEEPQQHIPVPRVLAWKEEEPRAQSDESYSYEFEPVDRTSSVISTVRPLGPRRPLKELIRPESNIEDRKPKDGIPAFEDDGEDWDTQGNEIETQSTQNEIIEDFRGDYQVLERLQVTSEELHALSRVSMLGTLTTKQDLLFMLRQIREATEAAEVDDNVSTEPAYAEDENAELSRDVSGIAEGIRRAAHAKLVELDSANAKEERKKSVARRHIKALGGRVNTLLSRRNSLSLSLRTR
ncbi:MAG: hypothetical protein ABSD30_07085 [Candidatus Binatus sp.]|jgi:hypothetical protein